MSTIAIRGTLMMSHLCRRVDYLMVSQRSLDKGGGSPGVMQMSIMFIRVNGTVNRVVEDSEIELPSEGTVILILDCEIQNSIQLMDGTWFCYSHVAGATFSIVEMPNVSVDAALSLIWRTRDKHLGC